MSTHRRHSSQTQPRTYNATWNGLLALPYRLCNPPHAVGKVRSCGVTPVFNVRLEDVLDRKHLPPLGLKDFEEWLLYVEMSPENLYFILWLREYSAKYKQWIARSRQQRGETGQYRVSWPLQTNPQLAMFYARAKQTFFTPNSDYELNVASDVLTPFHTQNGSPHPDPAVFAEVACEVQKMLRESLQRFVIAAYNNVGNNRVMCGMIAGTLFSLMGTIPPLVCNFVLGNSRWLRLAALPGLFLGLTILIASLHGVCVGVYIFGDLRQLRKFELSRPPISRPQPFTGTLQHRPVISSPLSTPPISHPHPVSIPSLTYPNQLLRLVIPPPPPPAHGYSAGSVHTLTPSFYSSTSSSGSTTSLSQTEDANAVIHISPAYYDADPIEGPATTPASLDPHCEFPIKSGSEEDTSFAPTAPFIHPYEPPSDDEYDYSEMKHLPEEHQPISPFDFDALPPRSYGHMERNVLVIQPEEPPSASWLSPRGLIARIQSRCNRWRVLIGTAHPPDRVTTDIDHEKAGSEQPPAHMRQCFDHQHQVDMSQPQLQTRGRMERTESRVRTQFKLVKSVPAFAAPLTRVLSPIVVRGQWEIVVRSMMISFLISWVLLGSLLAVPVPSRL